MNIRIAVAVCILTSASVFAQNQKSTPTFQALPAIEERGIPSVLFAKFADLHPGSDQFVQAMKEKFTERFSIKGQTVNDQTVENLIVFCKSLESLGVFSLRPQGLGHPAIESLGAACESNEVNRIRSAYHRFATKEVIHEFEVALADQIQKRGGVEAFGKNMSSTLKGTEQPLLAFGMVALFVL